MPQGPWIFNQTTSEGTASILNIAAAAGNSLVKATPGRVMQINVNIASTGALTIYDSATVAGAATANIVYKSAAVVALGTVITLNLPCLNGIVVAAGTGSTIAVSYI